MTYDLINTVLARPKMYTLTGGYSEVAAFLEGYYSGLAKSPEGLPYATNWSSFLQWLTLKVDASASTPLRALHEEHQADSLENFRNYYQEFKLNDNANQSEFYANSHRT